MKPTLVVDLTGPSSVYGTRLLAEAGHRVVRVEAPAGDSVRRAGPFAGKHADLEHGAFHLFMNAGKESLTVAVGSAASTEVLLALIARADIAVLPRPLPIPAERLLAANPRLALVEVDEVPNELCAYARSGLLSLTGQPNEEPVILGGHAALGAIGLYTAVAAAACLTSVDATGQGARVEVSGLNCLQALVEQAALKYSATGKETTRRGFRGEVTALSGAFPCADGYWMISLGSRANWLRFRDWADDPVLSDPVLDDEDERISKRDLILDRIADWSRSRTKDELVQEAQARHIPASPVSTTGDLANDAQLLARGFLPEINHPELGNVRFPIGAIACASKNQLRPAPRLGEHTFAILRELGYSASEQQALTECAAV